MIVYNTTFLVNDEIKNEWLIWIKDCYIKQCMDTNCFLDGKLLEITSHKEDGADNFSLQFNCDHQDQLDQFKNHFLKKLEEQSYKKFGSKVLSFATEMREQLKF